MPIRFTWRGHVTNRALNELHAEAFGHEVLDDDWEAQLDRYSLGWVCAHDGNRLIGFVNVAWDGGVHSFILDTVVAQSQRRRGIGAELVRVAVAGARNAGCEWLHVDFAPEHRSFYLEACGFAATEAGLIEL